MDELQHVIKYNIPMYSSGQKKLPVLHWCYVWYRNYQLRVSFMYVALCALDCRLTSWLKMCIMSKPPVQRALDSLWAD